MTPGPWRWKKTANAQCPPNIVGTIFGATDKVVCGEVVLSVEDARLIAAAPRLAQEHAEMREALRALDAVFRDWERGEDMTLADYFTSERGDAALSKARALLATLDARKEAS